MQKPLYSHAWLHIRITLGAFLNFLVFRLSLLLMELDYLGVGLSQQWFLSPDPRWLQCAARAGNHCSGRKVEGELKIKGSDCHHLNWLFNLNNCKSGDMTWCEIHNIIHKPQKFYLKALSSNFLLTERITVRGCIDTALRNPSHKFCVWSILCESTMVPSVSQVNEKGGIFLDVRDLSSSHIQIQSLNLISAWPSISQLKQDISETSGKFGLNLSCSIME